MYNIEEIVKIGQIKKSRMKQIGLRKSYQIDNPFPMNNITYNKTKSFHIEDIDSIYYILPQSDVFTKKFNVQIFRFKKKYAQYYEAIKNYEKSNHYPDFSNKKGVVYTNYKIAMEMIQMLDIKLDETIFEPACGAGVFVLVILAYISEKYNPTSIQMKEFVENKLFFADIDEDALDFTVEIVQQFLQQEYNLSTVSLQYNNEDSLKNQNHYDVIVGNPPYIRFQNLSKSHRDYLKQEFEFCAKGNVDIYYAFIELANKNAKRSCLIVPNSYLTNISAATLRNGLKDKVKAIRDHKIMKKFENASTYTSILHLDANKTEYFEYASFNNGFVDLSRNNLDNDRWNNLDMDLTNSDEEDALYLGSIADVHSGVQVGSNQAYFIEKNSLHNGYYSKKYNGKSFFIEKNICVELKKINKIFGKQQQKENVIIFPYAHINKIMKEAAMAEKYPLAYQYFLEIKNEILLQRDGGKKSYESWYAYARKQGFKVDFTHENCFLVPDTFLSGNFRYQEIVVNERFLHNSGFVLIAKEGYEELVRNMLSDEQFQSYLMDHGKLLTGDYIKFGVNILKNFNLNSIRLLNENAA